MRVLGIDPGSRVAGWAVVEMADNRLRAIAYGTVKSDTKQELPERLGGIYAEFEKIVKEHRPEELAVENVFVSVNARSALLLGQARAAAMLPGINEGLPVYEYTPMQVKKASTGAGAAGKEQVGIMVARLLGLKEAPKPEDVTDAISVAICHLHSSPMIRKAALK